MMDDHQTLTSPEIPNKTTKESLPAHIKEQSVSCIEGNLMEAIIYTSMDHTPYQSSHINELPGNLTSPDIAIPSDYTEHYPSPKEEPVLSDTNANIYTPTDYYIQYLPPHIKEENHAQREKDLTSPSIYIPINPAEQYPSIPIKEELVSCDGEHISGIYSVTDDTRRPAFTDGQKVANTKINEIEVIYQHPTQSTFGDISNLTKYQRTYSRKKTLQCAECGEYFLRKAQLSTHQRLHLGQNPLQCPECGRIFSGTSQLINHLKYHRVKKSFR